MLSRPHGPSGLGTDEADALSTGKVYKVAHVSPRHPGRRVSLRVRLAPRTNLRGVNPRTNSKTGSEKSVPHRPSERLGPRPAVDRHSAPYRGRPSDELVARGRPTRAGRATGHGTRPGSEGLRPEALQWSQWGARWPWLHSRGPQGARLAALPRAQIRVKTADRRACGVARWRAREWKGAHRRAPPGPMGAPPGRDFTPGSRARTPVGVGLPGTRQKAGGVCGPRKSTRE